MASAPPLAAVAMPSAPPSFPLGAFLGLCFGPFGPVSPAFLPFFGCPVVLPCPPGLIGALSTVAVVGGGAASLSALPVPVTVAVAPVGVSLRNLGIHVAQRCAAEAVLNVAFHLLPSPFIVRPAISLVVVVVVMVVMMVVVVRVAGPSVVVGVLTAVLLLQRQLPRLGPVSVVVAVVLRVYHQRPIQVGLHVAVSFPWVGNLG